MLFLDCSILICLLIGLMDWNGPLVVSAEAPGADKKTVVFVVGIEGSYHHYLLHVFKSIGAGILCKYNPGVVQDRYNWEEHYLQWTNSKNITTHYKCEGLGQRHDVIIHATESFPEGRPITPHSFPNIRGFLRLNATGKINLRLLYLNRDVLDASISALQRFKPKGDVELVGKYLIMSMALFTQTIYRVPHFVFSDSDDEPTRLSNLQRLFAGIAEPVDVQKAVEANPFRFHKHTATAQDAIWRSRLEDIILPQTSQWPPEFTRGTEFSRRGEHGRNSSLS